MIAAGRRQRTVRQHGVTDTALQQKFESIYTEAAWGEHGGRSGPGSGQDTTQYARSVLRLIIYVFSLTSMADLPCGSMHWMPILLRDLRQDVAGFQYLGADIVRDVIDQHRTSFKNDSWMHFQTMDFTATPIRKVMT